MKILLPDIVRVLDEAGTEGLGIVELHTALTHLAVSLDALVAVGALRDKLRRLRKKGTVVLVGSTNHARYVHKNHLPEHLKVVEVNNLPTAEALIKGDPALSALCRVGRDPELTREVVALTLTALAAHA